MGAICRAAALLALFACGCGTVENLDRAATFDRNSGDAIIVMTAPSNVRLHLVPGTDDGVNWSCSGLATSYQVSSDGFVVVKVKPRVGKDKYAVAAIAIDPNGGDVKVPADNVVIPAFNAVPGQVTLVGGFTAIRTGSGSGTFVPRPTCVLRMAGQSSSGLDLRSDSSATRERALRYLSRNYPQLSNALVVGRMEWIYTTNGGC